MPSTQTQISEIRTRIASHEAALTRQANDLLGLKARLSRLEADAKNDPKIGDLVRYRWTGDGVKTTWEGIVTAITDQEITVGQSTIERDHVNDTIEIVKPKPAARLSGGLITGDLS